MVTVPFRWNLARRAELGRLVEGVRAASYPEMLDDLAECAARVVATAGATTMVFVGRSPESLFDYLSGVFFRSPWQDQLALLQLSVRLDGRALAPARVRALAPYLAATGVTPARIATAPRPVTFCDLVYEGATFARLFAIVRRLAEDEGADWNVVRRRLRFCGITPRKKTSPNAFRWQEHAAWRDELPRSAIRNVSIPPRLWSYLGDHQDKTTDPYVSRRWGAVDAASPSRDPARLAALRLAADLFDLGRERRERLAFAARLAARPEMKHAWLRDLVESLRRASR